MTAVLISNLIYPSKFNPRRRASWVGGERWGGGGGGHGLGNGVASGTGGEDPEWGSDYGWKDLNIPGEADVVQSWKSLSA